MIDIKSDSPKGDDTTTVSQTDGTRVVTPKRIDVSVTPNRDTISVNTTITQVQPEQQLVKNGLKCNPIFIDTFFDDYSLYAEPKYNFYTVDEDTDETRKDRELALDELPRFITLSWNIAPDIRNNNMEYKRPDDRTPQRLVKKVNAIPGLLDPSSAPIKSLDLVSNDSLNLGAVPIKLTRFTTERYALPDEEMIIASNRYDGISVNDIVSNLEYFTKTAKFDVDTIGTKANVSVKTANAFDDITTKINAPQDIIADVVLVGQTSLGVLSNQHSNIDSREHLENVMKLSANSTEIAMLESLYDVANSIRIEPPSEKVPEMEVGSEYIGYVIEKQRMGDDGVFVTVDTFTIIGNNTELFVDTAVSYGKVYRYRICSLMRWIHRNDIDVFSMEKNIPLERKLTSLGSRNTAHYFRSSWSNYINATVIDMDLPKPPEQLKVMPRSSKGEVLVSWVFPDDTQKDIIAFSLYRKKMKGNTTVSEWEVLASNLRASNGVYIDRPEFVRDEAIRYVYAMVSHSIHAQTSNLSEQLSCRLVVGGPEDIVRQVSVPGVPLMAHGAFAFMPPKRINKEIMSKTGLYLHPKSGKSKFVNSDIDLVLRIQSLDTGEAKDIILDVNYLNSNSKLPPDKVNVMSQLDANFPADAPVKVK